MRWQFLVFIFSFAMNSAAADGPDAWWVICDSCTTDVDFRHAAQESPIDGFVFVSNGNSGITQKFQRITMIEDAPGEIIVSVLIYDLPIPDGQAALLDDALESARVYLSSVPRDAIPILGPADSIVDDLQNGRLRADFITNLRVLMKQRGRFPTTESLSGTGGVTFRGIKIEGTATSNQARTQPLAVRIFYPDGSLVSLVFTPDSVDVQEVVLTDAEGTILPTEDDSLRLDREGFIGRDFEFGAPAHELLHWLNSAANTGGGQLECRAEITDSRVKVICRQP